MHHVFVACGASEPLFTELKGISRQNTFNKVPAQMYFIFISISKAPFIALRVSKASSATNLTLRSKARNKLRF